MKELRFLKRGQIDTAAWDATVLQSGTGLPYAYSWYLDATTDRRWSALVTPDYRMVFPLPWNRKLLGLAQVYQPPFTQQLGLLGANVSEADSIDFLAAIPPHFQRVQLMLHVGEASQLPEGHSGTIRWKTNLVLPLDRSFSRIREGFSKSLRKRIRAVEPQLVFQETNEVVLLVDYYRQALEHKVGLSAKDYQRAIRLFQQLCERKLGRIYQVVDTRGQLLAMGLFVQTESRIINLFGASNQAGRACYAMHFLLTKVMEHYAGQALLFDFEGSEVPGVAQFFRSFGAVEQPFWAYQWDRTPFRQVLALKAALTGR